MPATHIHIISNILLIGLIYLFDKEIQGWFKKDKNPNNFMHTGPEAL